MLSESVRYHFPFNSNTGKVCHSQSLWKGIRGWGLKTNKRRQHSTKPILKFLWKEGGIWGDEEEWGKLQKQICAPDPSGSQILSVWAKNSLLFQVLSLVAVWFSLPLPLTKPQGSPTPLQLPQDTLLNVWKYSFAKTNWWNYFSQLWFYYQDYKSYNH